MKELKEYLLEILNQAKQQETNGKENFLKEAQAAFDHKVGKDKEPLYEQLFKTDPTFFGSLKQEFFKLINMIAKLFGIDNYLEIPTPSGLGQFSQFKEKVKNLENIDNSNKNDPHGFSNN